MRNSEIYVLMRAVWLGCLLLLPRCACCATLSEPIVGDFSNDRLHPTAWSLDLGANLLTATSGFSHSTTNADREFVTFHVPTGTRLAQLVLDSYTGLDGRAFIGMVAGPVFSVNPAAPVLADMLGWKHFGPADGDVGHDILPAMGVAIGVQGFLPPLSAGDYSLWIEQGGDPCTYTFDFLVITAPLLTGDANGDCVVGAADYAIWAAQFGQTGADLAGDFDGSGTVGAADYALWAANFGKICAPAGADLPRGANVPEPASALLAILASVMLVHRRRWMLD